MNKFTLQERANFYALTFPKWPPLRTDSRWIDGIWVLGNNYKGSGMYGAYPPNYLKRVMSLFPDAKSILHLFSGSLPPGNYTRFDIQGEPEVKGDAYQLSSFFQSNSFDLILADPPYSNEDAEHYGRPLVNRTKVVSECRKIIQPGGFLVWLDQVLPMFTKREWNLCGLIGIVRSTNHRFRVVNIFQKIKEKQK